MVYLAQDRIKMNFGIIAKLCLNAVLAAIEHTHMWNNQRNIGIATHKFTCHLKMLFKGHREIERLNSCHDRLKIWCIHLAAHLIHIDRGAIAQSTIVRWWEPAVPFDAVILIQVIRDRQTIIWTLPAVGVAPI